MMHSAVAVIKNLLLFGRMDHLPGVLFGTRERSDYRTAGARDKGKRPRELAPAGTIQKAVYGSERSLYNGDTMQ
jgi:hypothetical protein